MTVKPMLGKFMGVSAAAVIALSASTAGACDYVPDRASILIGSKHVGWEGGQLNETNPGAFLTWECGKWSATSGVFKNSYSNTSTALTASYDVLSGDGWAVSAFAGVAHYPGTGRDEVVSIGGSDVIAMGGLQARYKNVFVQAIPGDFETLDGIVAVGMTFGF